MTRRGTLWFGWTLALLAIAGFARLGAWQYGRMQEKEALLANVAQVLRGHDVRPLDDARTDLAWVEGDGRIDARTLLLDNQMREGRAGVAVYCVVAAGTTHRLVDFGWLPLAGDRTMPAAACPPGAMHVRGLRLPPPSSGLRMGDAMQQVAAGRWLMTRVDPDAISRTLGVHVAPVVVRLDPKLPVGYTRDLDVLPNTLPPERHLGYAVQWWALALAVFATALLLTFRKRPTSRSDLP